jgi:hypothetical protein
MSDYFLQASGNGLLIKAKAQFEDFNISAE